MLKNEIQEVLQRKHPKTREKSGQKHQKSPFPISDFY